MFLSQISIIIFKLTILNLILFPGKFIDAMRTKSVQPNFFVPTKHLHPEKSFS